jgi:hypothetical protein
MTDYAALSKTPHALADGLMLAFQHPVDWASRSWGLFSTLNAQIADAPSGAAAI